MNPSRLAGLADGTERPRADQPPPGLAAGAGYVLGRGLPSFVSSAVVRVGLRARTSFVVGRLLASASGEVVGDG